MGPRHIVRPGFEQATEAQRNPFSSALHGAQCGATLRYQISAIRPSLISSHLARPRKAIRLGKATAKQAAAFKVKPEQLVAANITGSMDDETARWLGGLDERIALGLLR